MVDRKGFLVTIGVRTPKVVANLILTLCSTLGRGISPVSVAQDMGFRENGQEDWYPCSPTIYEDSTREPPASSTSLITLLHTKESQHNFKVSSIALSPSLSHLAIGLADGTVLLYRQLDQYLSPSGSLTSLPKARTVHESPTEPITGLGFREPSPGDEAPVVHLFIVTTNRVLCYKASGRGTGTQPVEVDEKGAALGCAVMDWKGKEIVIARTEAIFLCGTEGRGASLAYEGDISIYSVLFLALTTLQAPSHLFTPTLTTL